MTRVFLAVLTRFTRAESGVSGNLNPDTLVVHKFYTHIDPSYRFQ